MGHDLYAGIGLSFQPPHGLLEIVHPLHHAVFKRVVALLAEEVAQRRLKDGGLGGLMLEGDVLKHGKGLGIEAEIDAVLHVHRLGSGGRAHGGDRED